ncbi:MAG TPA: universal stress protein [Solirubrobacter sp.]|nr:universal stress protein [Solirubrobacter sp.]
MTETTRRPVLVGIDGTASGLEALALGSAFAVLTGAPLVLGAVYGYQGGSLVWPPLADAEAWLAEAGTRVSSLLPWSTRTLLSSSPAHGLISLADLEDAAMIVLGSNRDGPVGHVLAGSTARRVAHGAPCAVAVAPHDWRTQPPDVPLTFGVGVCEALESREALALAGTFAAAGHAPLKVLVAVHVASPAHPMYAATGTSYEGWRRSELARGRTVGEEALAAVGLPADVSPAVEVLEGDPIECLARASRALDVLIVGSRRYGPVRSALLGGVSAPLIERAACPVVIVPRGVHAVPETSGAQTSAALAG